MAVTIPEVNRRKNGNVNLEWIEYVPKLFNPSLCRNLHLVTIWLVSDTISSYT